MKKFAYLTLFLLVIAGAYLGFSYYSQHIAAQKIQTATDKINLILSTDPRFTALNKTIVLNTTLEEKSLFANNYKLTFQITDNNADSNDRNARKRVTLNLASESGFFPLSNLRAFNFTPVLNKITLEFPSNLLSRDYLQRPNIDRSIPLGNAVFTLLFDETVEISANIAALQYTNPSFPFSFDGGHVNLTLSGNNTISTLTAELNPLEININSPWIPAGHIIDNVIEKTEQSTRHHFKFKKIKVDYAINPGAFNFFSAKKHLELEDFSFSILQYPILKLSRFVIDQAQIDRSNIIEIENNLKLSDLNLYGLNIGSGHSTFISLHRNFDAVDTFYKTIFNDIKTSKYKRTSLNTEFSISDFIISAEALTKRLVSNPGYQLIPFQWENSQGTLTIKSELIFSNPSNFSTGAKDNVATSSEPNYDKINTFHIDITSQKGVLPYLMTQLDQINGLEQLVANERNNQLIDKNLDLLINTGIISINQNLIQFAFSFTDNRFVLNGVPYSREQFLEFISLVSLRQTGLISPDNLIRLNQFITDQMSGG